ncbi:MAG: S-methyl-5'-thioadenosine phosphorylase [Acidobacteriota bacterium]
MEWHPVDYGIVGGSGFYEMPGFEEETRVTLKTPFGEPSDAYVLGRIGPSRVAFLARHGVGHRLLPTEVNFRANVYGFKLLGAKAILSASAVGSLKERYAPGEAVVPDQMVDRTRHRNETFFGAGIVAHVSFADPFCPVLRQRLVEACRRLGITVHDGGIYLCMEGPAFSTRAESNLYRAWGMDVIGMTGAQEAKLCREAEICYATLALVTDYDCWHPSHASVQIEEVLRILAANTENARAVLGEVAAAPPPDAGCSCRRALDHAVVTRRDLWPEETFQRLRPLLRRILGEEEKP